MAQYKIHVLTVLEFPTPAVYHATNTALDNLEKVQRHFWHELGLSKGESLAQFNLAPLDTRRDVALLGLVHRTVLGEGPPNFARWFFIIAEQRHHYTTRRQAALHNKQFYDLPGSVHTELLRRSPLGLVRMHNRLAQDVVDADSTSSFQAKLQTLVKEGALRREENWELLLSPRRTWWVRHS